jgi:hypothetical protein
MLKDFATVAVALAMTGALVWYVVGTAIMSLPTLAVVAVLLIGVGVAYWLLSDMNRRRTILAQRFWFRLAGGIVLVAAVFGAIAAHHFPELTHNGFGFFTVLALMGMELMLLPRWCRRRGWR